MIAKIQRYLAAQDFKWWFLAAFVLSYAVFSNVDRISIAEPAAIVVDMNISAGQRAVVRWNRDRRPPSIQIVSPGERKEYMFTGPDRDVRALRFDFFDTPGASADIYGVRLEHKGRVIATWTPAELAAFNAHGLGTVSVKDGALHVESPNGRGYLRGPTRHVVLDSGFPRLLVRAIDALEEAAAAPQLVLLCFAGFAAFTLFRRQEFIQGVVAVAAFFLPLVVIPPILRVVDDPPAIDSTVGRAAYFGSSTAANGYANSLSLLVGVFCAIIGYLLSKRVIPATAKLETEKSATPEPNRRPLYIRVLEVAIPVVFVSIIAWYLFPDIPAAMWRAAALPYPSSWDNSNALTWSYMASKGHLPLREFWYPYGSNYLFHYEVAFGFLWRFVYFASVHIGLYLALYLISGRRLLWPIVCWVLLGLGERAIMGVIGPNLFPSYVRSLTGLVSVLAYLAIDQRAHKFQFAHALFGLTCCVAIFFEPSQLLNAVPAVGLLLCLDVCLNRPGSWTLFAGRMVRELAIPCVFLSCYLVVVVVQGRWDGFTDFYLHLGDSAKYSAVPTDLGAALADPFSTDYLAIAMPVALVALGFVERLQRQGRLREAAANALIGMGVFGFMVLQKHSVRPMLAWCFLPQAVAVVCYGALRLQEGRRHVQVLLGIAAAAYLAMITADPWWNYPATRLSKGGSRIAGSLDVLLRRGPQAETIDIVKRVRFDDNHFKKYPDELAVAERIRTIRASTGTATIFVLGDESFFYVLMDQDTPYHINCYNASPIYEQQKVLEWLLDVTPDYVVINPSINEFDGVPHHVRVPLIYNQIVPNYVPDAFINGYVILRKRQAEEALATDFWKAALGANTHYRHLARNPSFDRITPCSSGDDCSDVLEVTFDAGLRPQGDLKIDFVIEGTPVGIFMSVIPNESEYRLRLDRVWFWNAAETLGLDRRIVAGGLPDGISARVVRGRANPSVLY